MAPRLFSKTMKIEDQLEQYDADQGAPHGADSAGEQSAADDYRGDGGQLPALPGGRVDRPGLCPEEPSRHSC